VSTLPLARGVKLVHFVGLVWGDLELDIVAGAVRFVVRGGVQDAARFCVQFALLTGVAAAPVVPDAVAWTVQHVASDNA